MIYKLCRWNFNAALQEQKQQADTIQKQQQIQQQAINDAFNNLKVMRDAMGVDTIVGDGSVKTYSDQVQIVDNIQEE